MTTTYADLEISLRRQETDAYRIELRFSQPNSDADIRLTRSDPLVAQLPITELTALQSNIDRYGARLGECLLADQAIRQEFAQVRRSIQSLDSALRVRLAADPNAPELHNLRWEALRNPEDGALLFVGEEICFSRYLSTTDWRPVQLRVQGEQRALVVVANPTDITTYAPGGQPLSVVDVPGEVARARAGLGDIPVTTLESGGSATLEQICTHLRDGYDILYLVAHGALIQGESILWLEDANGAVARVKGQELVEQLRNLSQRPALIVLASCQSAGTGSEPHTTDNGALAALGPRLAEAGIPAVLAMQGNVSMGTVAQFMPAFFRELTRDGQIDRAVAVARNTVRERPDFWMPVLFMRLKSGRLWYVPGFGENQQAFEKWPALLRRIQRGQCTPILGAYLYESLIGSSREIARQWAETHRYPLQPHEREDLPQVAQYLAVYQEDPQFPNEELLDHIRNEILQRYGKQLPETAQRAPLGDLFKLIGEQRRATNPADPYKVLAEQPFPIYVTTNASNLLTEALRAAGKTPQVELCRWNEHIADLPSIFEDEPEYEPSAEAPLVFHLFGIHHVPDSLVVTEDNYFDFLIGVSARKELIPIPVRTALTNTALLFLGFRIDDWNFRVLFRSIMNREGSGRLRKLPHIAAQFLPEEGRFLEPERASRYLENYFQDSDISIYWGSTEDFVKEMLSKQL